MGEGEGTVVVRETDLYMMLYRQFYAKSMRLFLIAFFAKHPVQTVSTQFSLMHFWHKGFLFQRITLAFLLAS
jgi:hypothetical protein